MNTAIQNALDGLIPTLGFTHQEISGDDINNLTSQIQSQVEDAVKNQQNFFENIWSWLNSDDTIGTVVWKFSGDTLLDQNPVALQRWPNEAQKSNDNGDWELFGNVNSEELPTCPTEVVKVIVDSLFGESSSKKSMQALYDFRNREMKKYSGLGLWWQIAQRNSYYLKHALKNKEVANEAISLFKEIPEILKNKEKPIDDSHFDSAMKVLNHILTINAKDRQSRNDIKRSVDALHILKGKSPNQIFDALTKVRPARYPSIKALG